jgi:UDP-2,3-diacylglucosamine pyrophosphatase LpxH
MSKGMSKEETIESLKTGWGTMDPVSKKELIYSLLGHRMSFYTITQLTDRTIEEIKAAYKGDSNTIWVSPSFDDPMKLVEDTGQADGFSGLPDDCGHSGPYLGTVAPFCSGGYGCKACWAKYESVNHIEPEPGVSPKIMEIAPSKAMYHLTFDDLLDKYREHIGWKNYPTNIPTPGDGPNDPEYLNGIIISDLHVPFHDEEKFAEMINQTRGKVDICILAGDGPDFHSYSRFIKYGQHFTVKDEHKAFMAVLATLSESYPEIIMFPGNHDERTRKYYAQKLEPEFYQAILSFHGANAFDFSELMTRQFENIVIPTMPSVGFADYRFVYQVAGTDIVVGHPELFSKIACKSVSTFIDWLKKKAQPEGIVKHFNHAVMGHTHQAGKIYADFGVIGIENASLCMTPDYDGNPKLSGCLRPIVHGYTRFKTNRATGITAKNDINLVYL